MNKKTYNQKVMKIKRRIFFLFITIMNIILIVSKAKYTAYKDITIAKINVDTIIPKIEITNMQKTMYNKNNESFFDLTIKLNIIESYIKENNITDVKIMIDNIETKNFEIGKTEKNITNIEYEIKIKQLHKNQKFKMIIPEGIIVDNANNKNEEKIIEYEIK